MHHSKLAPIALALVAACQPAAPAALSDADKAAMEALDQQFVKLALAGDFAGLVKAYYSEDAVVMAPNAPPAKGQAAAEALLRTFPPITAFAINTEEIVGVGDLAYARGRYTMTMSPPGAAAIADTGKFIEIWRKQADGSWKATRDMFSSDIPLPAPPPAPAPAKKP